MQIRTFSADKLHQALSMVRKEFGPDAMILDRNKARDEEGHTIWQVRAARDSEPAVQPKHQAVSQPDPAGDYDHRMQHSMLHLERIVSHLGSKEADTLRNSLSADDERRAFDTLLQHGVAATHARDLAPCMAREGTATASCLRWGRRLDPAAQRTTVLISGPAGAGKTTMIANLAMHFHLLGVTVALITTDTERMGGVESLAAYASLLGIPLHALRRPEDVADILQKTESARLLLIDSEGCSQANRRSRLRQAPLWQALSPDRRMLLLPANMDEADGMAVIQAASALHLTDLLPSKLDETSATGKVVNWAADSRLPLSYCGFGPSVPDQMGWLNPRTLATLLQRKRNRETS